MTVKTVWMRDEAEALYDAAIYKMQRESLRSHLWEAAWQIRIACGMDKEPFDAMDQVDKAIASYKQTDLQEVPKMSESSESNEVLDLESKIEILTNRLVEQKDLELRIDNLTSRLAETAEHLTEANQQFEKLKKENEQCRRMLFRAAGHIDAVKNPTSRGMQFALSIYRFLNLRDYSNELETLAEREERQNKLQYEELQQALASQREVRGLDAPKRKENERPETN